MARQTLDVRRQTDRLVDHYLEKGYHPALRHLISTLRTVAKILDKPDQPPNSKKYPSVYVAMSRPGLSWFKVHVYWIGYIRYEDGWLMTNFFHEAGDMPSRVLTEIGRIVPL